MLSEIEEEGSVIGQKVGNSCTTVGISATFPQQIGVTQA